MDAMREAVEAAWTMVVREELEWKAAVGVFSLIPLAFLLWICLRRGKAPRDTVEGGMYNDMI